MIVIDANDDDEKTSFPFFTKIQQNSLRRPCSQRPAGRDFSLDSIQPPPQNHSKTNRTVSFHFLTGFCS